MTASDGADGAAADGAGDGDDGTTGPPPEGAGDGSDGEAEGGADGAGGPPADGAGDGRDGGADGDADGAGGPSRDGAGDDGDDRSEDGDVVGEAVVDCPACGTVGPHEVLNDGGQATVRCGACDHVHTARLDAAEEVERRIVVSQNGEDTVVRLGVPASETIAVGDAFVVDADDLVVGVEVTSLEIEAEGDNERVERATAEEVDTVWTVAVDNVAVPVTLHRSDGTSESHDVTVPGDYSFVVGEEETVDGVDAEVTAFMTESGQRLRYEGDDVAASNVKRLYCEAR